MNAFYSLNEYYKKIFGCKAYKISLNAGLGCPNRDGTIGTGGCIFCSSQGSGDFAAGPALSISEQIDYAIEKIRPKYKGNTFIAYFQAYTNTYAPVDRLRRLYMEAALNPNVAGISIATRPDCLSDDVIELIKEINSIKPVWIELGLQTTNEKTAQYIRRGYTLDVFENAVYRLNKSKISVVVHIIIGLPGETHADYINTANYIARCNINGIKIQLLHVLKGSDLANEYMAGKFTCLSLEEYVKTVVDIIELLPPEMVIHRITGDGPKKILIAPLWSSDKKKVLNAISKEFTERNTYQGKEFR